MNRFSSAWQPSVTVPPGREQLEIHYTGLNFSAPGRCDSNIAWRPRNRLDGGRGHARGLLSKCAAGELSFSRHCWQ